MEKGKPYTITHFVAMRIPRRTIYRIIVVMERTWSTEGVAGSGPPASELPHRLQGSGWQRPQTTRLE